MTNNSEVKFSSSVRFGGARDQINRLVLTRLTIENGAKMICPEQFNITSDEIILGSTSGSQGVVLQATKNLTIYAKKLHVGPSAQINAAGTGTPAGVHINGDIVRDRGSCPACELSPGGSYGGAGQGVRDQNEYGSYIYPCDVGSSGGNSQNGGRGGGMIRVIASTLQLDGFIVASGLDGRANTVAGGGAGGSIWVDADECDGVNGTLAANGGHGGPVSTPTCDNPTFTTRKACQASGTWYTENGGSCSMVDGGREMDQSTCEAAPGIWTQYNGGGGAGGRIALYCHNNIPFEEGVNQITANGAEGRPNYFGFFGSAGTVYAKYKDTTGDMTDYLVSSLSLVKGGEIRKFNVKLIVTGGLTDPPNQKTVEINPGGVFSLRHLSKTKARAFGSKEIFGGSGAVAFEKMLVSDDKAHIREEAKGTLQVVDAKAYGEGTGRSAFYDVKEIFIKSGGTLLTESKLIIGKINCKTTNKCVNVYIEGVIEGLRELHIIEGATVVLGAKGSIESELVNHFNLKSFYMGGGSHMTLPYGAKLFVEGMLRVGDHDYQLPQTTLAVTFNATIEAGVVQLLTTARVDGQGRGFGLDYNIETPDSWSADRKELYAMTEAVSSGHGDGELNGHKDSDELWTRVSSKTFAGGSHAGRGFMAERSRSYGHFDYPLTAGSVGFHSTPSAKAAGGAAVRFIIPKKGCVWGEESVSEDDETCSKSCVESDSWKLVDGTDDPLKEQCGTMLVNGTISMAGADATQSQAGGGAGGSILLEVLDFFGFGTIIAGGGDSVSGGGGGGGRVALRCLACIDETATKMLAKLSVLGGTSAANHLGPGGPGTLYNIWYSQDGQMLDELTVDHEHQKNENVPTTQLLHSTGKMHFESVKLIGSAKVSVVSDDIAQEALVLMTFNKFGGDGTGKLDIDRFATVTPLLASPWVLNGKVQVLAGGELKFDYAMDMQLTGTSSLSVLGKFTSKNGFPPSITTINGTCEFLAGSRAQSEAAVLSASTGAYEKWTHHFSAINVQGGRVTLPGSGRVLVDNLVDILYWGILRVENGLELTAGALTCGTTGSSLISTIEWYGSAKLVACEVDGQGGGCKLGGKGTITLYDSCKVDGKGRGFSLASGPWGLNSKQGPLINGADALELSLGATHGGTGGGIDELASNSGLAPQWLSGYLGGIAGYGHYIEALSLGAGSAGGSGGAAINLEATEITVDGTIDADGDAGTSALGGAAGGSIWLKASIDVESETLDSKVSPFYQYTGGKIKGSGSLTARGGDGKNGGGGGRISIVAGTKSIFPGTALVHGGQTLGGGAPGGAGTIAYTAVSFYKYYTSTVTYSYIQHPYPASTIIVDNNGYGSTLKTYIFDGYSTSLVLATVQARGNAMVTFGTRSTLKVKLEITVNIFLGDVQSTLQAQANSKIYIFSSMVLTMRGADSSSPAVEKIVVMTMLSETISLVTEQRLFYLADVGLAGIDFESEGVVTFPNKVNLERAVCDFRGQTRGFQFLNIAYEASLFFHVTASTGGAPPNNFEFNTLNIRDGGVLQFPIGATVYAYHISIGNEGSESSRLIVNEEIKFFVDFDFIIHERGWVDGTSSTNGADILISSCLGTVVNDDSICIRVDGTIDVTTTGGGGGKIKLNSTIVRGTGTLTADRVNIRARNTTVELTFDHPGCVTDLQTTFLAPEKKAYECSCDDMKAKEDSLNICQDTVKAKELRIDYLANVEVYRWKLKTGDQREQKEQCQAQYAILTAEDPVQYYMQNGEWPPMGGGGGGPCKAPVILGSRSYEYANLLSVATRTRLQSWLSPRDLVPTTVNIQFQLNLYYTTVVNINQIYIQNQYNNILNIYIAKNMISDRGITSQPQFDFYPGELQKVSTVRVEASTGYHTWTYTIDSAVITAVLGTTVTQQNSRVDWTYQINMNSYTINKYATVTQTGYILWTFVMNAVDLEINQEVVVTQGSATGYLHVALTGTGIVTVVIRSTLGVVFNTDANLVIDTINTIDAADLTSVTFVSTPDAVGTLSSSLTGSGMSTVLISCATHHVFHRYGDLVIGSTTIVSSDLIGLTSVTTQNSATGTLTTGLTGVGATRVVCRSPLGEIFDRTTDIRVEASTGYHTWTYTINSAVITAVLGTTVTQQNSRVDWTYQINMNSYTINKYATVTQTGYILWTFVMNAVDLEINQEVVVTQGSATGYLHVALTGTGIVTVVIRSTLGVVFNTDANLVIDTINTIDAADLTSVTFVSTPDAVGTLSSSLTGSGMSTVLISCATHHVFHRYGDLVIGSTTIVSSDLIGLTSVTTQNSATGTLTTGLTGVGATRVVCRSPLGGLFDLTADIVVGSFTISAADLTDLTMVTTPSADSVTIAAANLTGLEMVTTPSVEEELDVSGEVETPIVCGVPMPPGGDPDIFTRDLRDNFENGNGNFSTEGDPQFENMTNQVSSFTSNHKFVHHRYSMSIDLVGAVVFEYKIQLDVTFNALWNVTHLSEYNVEISLRDYYDNRFRSKVHKIEVQRVEGHLSKWTCIIYTYDEEFKTKFDTSTKQQTCSDFKNNFQMNETRFGNVTRVAGDTRFSEAACSLKESTMTRTLMQHRNHRTTFLQNHLRAMVSSCKIGEGCSIEVTDDYSLLHRVKIISESRFGCRFIVTMTMWNSVRNTNAQQQFVSLDPEQLRTILEANKDLSYTKFYDTPVLRIPVRAVFRFRYDRQVTGTFSRLYQLRNAMGHMISTYVSSCSNPSSCAATVVPLGISDNSWSESSSFVESNRTSIVDNGQLTSFTTFSVQVWAASCRSCPQRNQASNILQLFQNMNTLKHKVRKEMFGNLLLNMQSPSYPIAIQSFDLLPNTAVAVGHVNVLEERKSEIVAGISHRTSSLSFDYHIKMLLSKRLHLVFNVSAAASTVWSSHINQSSIISAMTTFFGGHLAVGRSIVAVRDTSVVDWMAWNVDVYTNNQMLSWFRIENHLQQRFGVNIRNVNETGLTPMSSEQDYAQMQEELTNIVNVAIQGEMCAKDDVVMNDACIHTGGLAKIYMEANVHDSDSWLMGSRKLTVVAKASDTWMANALLEVLPSTKFETLITAGIQTSNVLRGLDLNSIGWSRCSWTNRSKLGDRIDVGCRHRARIIVHMRHHPVVEGVTSLQSITGWTSQDLWNLRTSFFHKVCQHKGNDPGCFVDSELEQGQSNMLRIIASVSSEAAVSAASIHMSDTASCNLWLHSVNGIAGTSSCTDKTNTDGSISPLKIINLLPQAHVEEVIWHPAQKDFADGGFETNSKESDFRFSCTSGADVDNENEKSAEVCMFAYRILPLGGGTLTGGKNYSAASNETVEEERPWLHVNASSLLIRDTGNLQDEIVYAACLYGAVTGGDEEFPCLPALGPGKYRMEVLASFADDPEYEQDLLEPTEFEWEIIQNVSSLSQDAKESIIDDLADDLEFTPPPDLEEMISSLQTLTPQDKKVFKAEQTKFAKSQASMAKLCNKPSVGPQAFNAGGCKNNLACLKRTNMLGIMVDDAGLDPGSRQGHRWQYKNATTITYRAGADLLYETELEAKEDQTDAGAGNTSFSMQYQFQTPNNADCDWNNCIGPFCVYSFRKKELVIHADTSTMKTDGQYAIGVRIQKKFLDADMDGLTIQTRGTDIQKSYVRWEVDRTSPDLEFRNDCTQRWCNTQTNKGLPTKKDLWTKCNSCDEMKNEKTSFVRSTGDQKDDDTMVLDIYVQNLRDTDILNRDNEGYLEFRIDHGELDEKGFLVKTSDNSGWQRLVRPHSQSGALECIEDGFQEDSPAVVNDMTCVFPIDNERKTKGRMFSVNIPPVGAGSQFSEWPVSSITNEKHQIFQRKIEVRSTDEAGNKADVTTFEWWQTAVLDDPNPKMPGSVSYKYVSECQIQVMFNSAPTDGSVKLPDGAPPSEKHLLWWSHSQPKTIITTLTDTVLNSRDKGDCPANASFGPGCIVQKKSLGEMELWSATMALLDETTYNLTLERPAYDNRTFFGVSAIAATDGLVPEVQTSIVGWTIAEDCKDSAYYLDVSGNMSCPMLEREDGSFRPDQDCEISKWQCRKCVRGGNCTGAVVYPNVGVLDGWWRSYWNSSIFLPCGNSEACLGAPGGIAKDRRCNSTSPPPLGRCNAADGYQELCARPFPELNQSDFRNTEIPEVKQCNLCTRCVYNDNETSWYGRSFGSTTKCETCWTVVDHIIIGAVLCLLFCSTIGWYIRANRKTGYRSNSQLLRRAVSLSGKNEGIHLENIDERAKYKLALVATANKCIVVLCYSGSLTIPWHWSVKQMFVVYKALSTFVGDYVRLDCLSMFKYEETFPFVFKDALFWVIAFPSVVLLFVFLAMCCSKTTKNRKINTIAAIMATIETLYPTICAKTFSLFACQWIGDRRFMVYDLDVECYKDARYTAYVVLLGYPSVIVFIAGIPLMTAVLLWSQRKSTHKNLAGRVFYRLLTVGLRPSHYLWRSMAKLRTASVVFILVYTSQYGPFIHVFAYTAALTATSIMEVVADPYRMIRIKAVGAVDGSKTASHKKTDVEHQNVFQKMRNYSVVIALGTIFLGSVQLGAESDQQWREHWWIDWNTLSDLLAAMTITVNVIYVAWMIQTVSSQFGKCKCLCPCFYKKPTRKLASITPELQQRRASASHKILKSLSHAAVSSKAKKLTEWKKKAEHEASAARLMSLANMHVPPTAVLPVLPKPSEAVVIQRVVEAGNKFTAAAEKKSAQEVQREKLLELAKQVRSNFF